MTSSDLPKIPQSAPAPPETIVLPGWLTPDFARAWLHGNVLSKKPRRGQSCSQRDRYLAIAYRRDWDIKRRWALVWREPYRDHYLADLAKETPFVSNNKHDNKHNPRLVFWHLARRAIEQGILLPTAVNALATTGESDGWETALQKLKEAL